MSINASYTVDRPGNGQIQINTRPGWVLGPVTAVIQTGAIIFLLAVLASIGGLEGFLWGAAFVAAFCLYAFKFAAWNKGRKACSFAVDPQRIVLASGETFDRSDITSLYMIAPKQNRTMVHSGTFGIGVSSSGGVGGTVASRSWRVEIEAKGRTHTLAGGLTEPMARAVMNEIGKVMAV